MRKDVIAKKYARAIYDSYKGDIKNALEALSKVIVASSNDEYNKVIQNPFFSYEQKADFVLSVVDTKEDKVINFIKLVAKKNKLIILPSIVNYLNLFYLNDSGKYEGSIFASQKMNQKDVDNLSKLVSKKISKDVSLSYKEDSKFNGVKISIEQLDLELVFSKDYIRNKLSSHILKAI